MEPVLHDINNKICTITINRPDQFNALNIETLVAINDKLDFILNDTNVRVVIITGSGTKSFVAGADISEMSKMNKDQAKQFSKLGQNLTVKIENFKIPIISAINGYALGGGCELALACHIRYASNNAIFGQPEVGLGLIAGWGGTQRLPLIVGKGIALEILLSANSINSKLAKQIGLVNHVFSEDELLMEVKRKANKIVENAPLAISSTIKSVNNLYDKIIREGLELEAEEFSNLFEKYDTKEGIAAFIEKRKPIFKGK
tara:strand:- start:377 stop:1153 length:777 start_codon:yes stop_codon:yes gene_type:complete